MIFIVELVARWFSIIDGNLGRTPMCWEALPSESRRVKDEMKDPIVPEDTSDGESFPHTPKELLEAYGSLVSL